MATGSGSGPRFLPSPANEPASFWARHVTMWLEYKPSRLMIADLCPGGRYARKLWITHLLKGAAYLPVDKKEKRRRWSAGEEGNADVHVSQ